MAMQLSGSLNLTGSLNVSGSIIGSISATNGIVSSSTQVQNYDVFALNSNLYTSTGSLIGITNELMSYTASLKAAAIVSSSTQVQNYDVFALNSNLYNSTGSIKGEIAGIEAYTASLKGAAIVSSSQQITNYYKFAETASANTFYGTQTITGSLNVGVGTSDNTAGDLLVDTANKTVYVGRQSSTSGDNTIFAVRNRLNTNNALYVDPGGTGVVQVTGSLEVTRGVKLGTATGNVEVVGNLVMSTAGNGIDFSATSNTAGTTSELLNDYETGTWTPAWNSTGGTITTISAQTTGVYTKIGNVVHIWARLYTNSVSSPTGEVTVSGLPFTVGSQVGNKAMHLFTLNAITGTLTGTPVIAFNDTNTTATIFNKIWNSTEFGGDIATYFDNDTWGYFYGTYLV